MAGQRAEPWAPPDVAGELREMQGAVSGWEQQADRETDPEQAAAYAGLASLVQDREAELDAEQQQRIDWDAAHSAEHEAARRATSELQRRALIEPEPEPEPAASRAELGGVDAEAGTGRNRSLFEAYVSLDHNEPNSYMALDLVERRRPVAEAGLAEPEIDEPEMGL